MLNLPTTSEWLRLTLIAVWWGCAILAIRAVTLAAAGRQRTRWLTPWTLILAIFNVALPAVIITALGAGLGEVLVLTALLLALDLLTVVGRADWSLLGAQSYTAVPAVALSFFGYALAVTLTTQMNWPGYTLSALLLLGELASAAIDLYYTSELLDVVCRIGWRGRLAPWQGPVASWPRVSVHVPTHNEEPEMVMRTLHAITQLDYPTYEVILIDDNSNDSATWRPVMEYCNDHNIKVFHLMQYPGYKAGALNFALNQTDPTAELIAIVDADYVVSPNWLRETAPYFQADPQLAFLQTPQSFSFPADDWYHLANAVSEDYFFTIGMPSRAERNSIIFCGTMGLIRRRVLERIGGWAEWCVTEDAEASLRMLSRGYRGAYVQTVYGRGALPPTLADLKRQHYRWAFGSIQVTRAYLGLLLFGVGRRTGDPRQEATLGKLPRLTAKQRYDYVMHGAHWYHAFLQISLGLLLNAIALLRVLNIPFALRPLVASALLLPVIGVVIGSARVVWSARVVMRSSWREAFGALYGLLGVHWAVTRACFAGLYRRRLPFFRTPKSSGYVTTGYALRSTLAECALALLAVLTIGALLWRSLSWDTLALSFLLLWQAFVMSAAPTLAFAQAAYDRRRRRQDQARERATPPAEAPLPVASRRD